MADNWQTYSIIFKGGLITNLSPYQHGIEAPGSARILRNFEPSVFGGYRRVEGYEKYDIATVPNTGLIRGVFKFGDNVYAVRGDDLFRSSGTLITAKVNGATSSSASVTVDTKAGTIATGMQVVGTGITGTVTVNTISAQDTNTATVVLSTTVTLADDTDLTFPKHRFKKFIKDVVLGTIERDEVIKEEVKKYLSEDLELTNLDQVFQVIVKSAIFEFLYKPKVSSKIIIKEYLDASNFFLEDGQTKYLNAILDKIAKKIRTTNA